MRTDVLTKAVREVVARHEPLRMRLRHDEEGTGQVFVGAEAVRADWEEVALTSPAELDRYLSAPLDSGHGAMRLLMLRDGEDHAYPLALLNHLACDGWGTRVFLRELWLAYRAIAADRSPDLPPIARTYSDHIRDQQAVAQRSGHRRGYWAAQADRFAQAATGLPEPQGPAANGVGRADIVRVFRGEPVKRALELARVLGVSPNTLPLAGLALAAASLADSDCAAISFIYSGRDTPAVQPLVGVFHRPVGLPVEVSGESLGTFLVGVSRSVFDALRHSRAPYSAGRRVRCRRATRRESPLVNVLYNQVAGFFGQATEGKPLRVDDQATVTFPGAHSGRAGGIPTRSRGCAWSCTAPAPSRWHA